MPIDDVSLRLPPRVRIECSVAAELCWLLICCRRPQQVLPLPAELVKRCDRFWGDDVPMDAELLVLSQSLGCLTGVDPSPLFEMGSTHIAPIGDLDLRTETDELHLVIARRLERLRRDARLRNRLGALLASVWATAEPAWRETGLGAVEHAVRRLRASAEHQLDPLGLLPKDSIALREEYRGLARQAAADGTLLLLPSHFAGERQFIIALPGVMAVSFGTGVSPDIAHRRAEAERVSKGLKLLSDPTRLLILTELDSQPATVGDIARRVAVSQPTASVHVKQLREAGLVVGAGRGSGGVYEVRRERVREILTDAQGVATGD